MSEDKKSVAGASALENAVQTSAVNTEKSEEQMQAEYAAYLQTKGFFDGLYYDAFCRKKTASKQAVENNPQNGFIVRAFDWIGARKYRVAGFYITSLAALAAISYFVGAPIWENSQAKHKAIIEQKIERYLSMDRHKVEARPIYSMYYNCIKQDENWGMDQLEDEKEAYRAAFKIIHGLKTDNVPKGWTESPCNNPEYEHVSEREPAPKK
jgi:hypothetical protein